LSLFRRSRTRFRRVAHHLNLKAGGRWIFLSTILGLLTGLAAAVFQTALDLAHELMFAQPEAALGSAAGPGGTGRAVRILFLLIVPALGASASAWLTYRFAPEAAGHGTDAVVHAYHRMAGRVRFRVAPIKLLASMLTLGSGGSAGREGPVAQFGGALGSTMARLFRFDARTRRILLLAGAAGGIGAIFRAPLGGALFTAEVIYRSPDFEGPAVFPGVIAAIVSFSTFSSLWGVEPVFLIPQMSFGSPMEIPFYIGMGLMCAAMGILYIKAFYGGEKLFRRLPFPAPARAACGGVGLGFLTVLFGLAIGNDTMLLGGGYRLAQDAIDIGFAPLILFLLAVAKILATTCTISSGGSGGVFAPSLAIGACLGSAFGQAAQVLFPDAAPPPAACALVGMGGFFAGVAKTPLTAVILISEMTGSYGLLVPLMLVSSVTCLLSPGWSIYREQVPARIDSPAHLGELASAALSSMRVSDTIDPKSPAPLVRHGETLGRLADRAVQEGIGSFAVVDDEDRLVGLLTVADLHRAAREPALANLVARDLARQAVTKVTPDLDLREAVSLLVANHEEDLVVVDPRERTRPLAILSRQHLLAAYQKHFRKEAE
jgi:CIC family chloride channel protein